MKVRATPEKGEGTGEAVVSTYDLEFEVGWGWTEKVLPGAFADSIVAHPTIPIFFNHDWDDGPIGSGQPTEADDQLTVAFQLYLGLGDRVDRVYKGMQDGALEEWSIGFWAEEILWDKDSPQCDQIALGDLAEASVCVRGANPATGTLELNGRAGWIDGDEQERQKEVARLRSRYNVPEIGKKKTRKAPAKRADDDTDEPDPAALAQAFDALIDEATVLVDAEDLAGAKDILVAADSTSDDLLEALGVPDDDGVAAANARRRAASDTGDDEAARARDWELLSSPLGRERLAALRSSQPAPSLP
jgi:HK97 family phage prohead protease